MRTFLTYVLAALAALLTASVFGAVRGELSGIGATQVAREAILIGLMSAAWGSLNIVFPDGGSQNPPARWVAKGVLAYSLVTLVIVLSMVQFAEIIFSSEPTFGQIAEATPTLLEVTGFGAAWGTVFWLRAPKPQTAGIAA